MIGDTMTEEKGRKQMTKGEKSPKVASGGKGRKRTKPKKRTA